MSSDDAYMSFLDKANADVSGSAPQQGANTVKTETVHSSLSVPKPLQSVDAYYISDTDEPFEPVALKWDGAAQGAWPSAGMFLLLFCFHFYFLVSFIFHILLHGLAPLKSTR
jgi:hypothetical protein